MVNLMNSRIQEFFHELSLLKDNEIIRFTELMIKNLPDRFFYEPASSTNKYHNEACNGVGGLVKHTKLAVGIGVDIMRTGMMGVVHNDTVISALILHDGWKYSDNLDNKFTVKHHALDSIPRIKTIVKENGFFDDYNSIPFWYQNILDSIQSHNGMFVKKDAGYEFNGVYSVEQKVVHLADYISSRKYMDIKVDKEDVANIQEFLSRLTKENIEQMEII